MGFGGCAVDERLAEARDVRDLDERRDRPEAFERVSLPVLCRPLLLLRAFRQGLVRFDCWRLEALQQQYE